MRKHRKRLWRGATLAVLLFALAGCVLSSRVEPPTEKAPAARLAVAPLWFSIRYAGQRMGNDPKAHSKLTQRVASYFHEQAGIFEATHVREDRLEGLYCAILIDGSGATMPGDSAWGWASGLTLGIVPYYSHNIFRVNYDLFRDGSKIGEFHYEVHQRFWFSIFLLPVAWVQLLLDDFEDAFVHTTRAFVADASPWLEAKP